MLRQTSKRLPASLVYVVAVGGTAVAALIRHFVGDLSGRGPLGPFFLAVLLSGWLGGWWPGLLATVLCTAVTAVFFVERTGLVFAISVTESPLLSSSSSVCSPVGCAKSAVVVVFDFRRKSRIINGYTDLMLTRFASEDPTRQDRAVRVAGERAASLTNQLLAFGRRQMRQPTIVDVGAVVEESAQALPRVLGARIEISVTSDQRPARTKADPDQLRQVLLNLAINAQQAMPEGGRLTFHTSVVDFDDGGTGHNHPPLPAGRYVRLSVDDTGSGMTPDVKARVFEPFFTTKEFGKGSGLGLAVVHGIVLQSGGHIEVASEPGRGATSSFSSRMSATSLDRRRGQAYACRSVHAGGLRCGIDSSSFS